MTKTIGVKKAIDTTNEIIFNKVVTWIKENVGDNARIITPQFKRTSPLTNPYIPKDEQEFNLYWDLLSKAPWEVLKGMGFGKWDTMNNLIKENNEKAKKQKVKIPVISEEQTEEYVVEIGKETSIPAQLLKPDREVILFPGEWYKIIPDGLMVTGLYGEQYKFKKGKSDDDIRFGCLPYGFQRDIDR